MAACSSLTASVNRRKFQILELIDPTLEPHRRLIIRHSPRDTVTVDEVMALLPELMGRHPEWRTLQVYSRSVQSMAPGYWEANIKYALRPITL